jgi:hypothetical protein
VDPSYVVSVKLDEASDVGSQLVRFFLPFRQESTLTSSGDDKLVFESSEAVSVCFWFVF